MEATADLIPIKFLPARVDVERRADGTLILRSPEPLRNCARCLGEHLERWAVEKPNEIFLAQRSGEGWRKITWSETRKQVYAIATALLERGVSVDHPIAVLSDNSIEHGLLALAAMHIGVPIAPISPAYSLLSKDFAKLKTIIGMLRPRLVFADNAKQFERAIAATAAAHDFEWITSENFSRLTERTDNDAVLRAFAAVRPETIAKFLFTSGSTGQPKAVINTQRMLCSNIQSRVQAWPFLEEEPQVLVDWLPWNHTFGGNCNFGLVVAHGGTMYIDAGKPLPGLIETTVRNLREISPTICFNAPLGYDALLPFLENDPVLRRSFFAKLKLILYGAAALPAHVWDRLQHLSMMETGKLIRMTAGWGSTETAPVVTLVHFEPLRGSVIGLPTPGCELKMVPADESRYELRVRGPNVTPGYWKQPELTAAAFDDEGFYKMGDAGRFADPSDPSQGIEFAGRLAEDFKLTSATWVHVGALRVRAIAAMPSLAQDIVIAGHDRDDIGFLIFPKAGTDIRNPDVREQVRRGMAALREEGGGCSTYATRAILLEEPPVIDAGEITDKGYINQRAVLERRAELVETLYGEPVDETVIPLYTT